MEIKSPKVSVILPCYNVEKYVAKSIQSVLNQTFVDFELLVIIDGSPDNSKPIAETFEDARISIYEKPNGGLSDARNYGLERAKGEFVYFMDSDDWIEPNLLEIALKKCKQYTADFIIFGYYLDNEDINENLLSRRDIFSENIIFSKQANHLVIDENKINLLGYAWNKIYKTSFLKENEIIFDKGISLVEDILFNSKVYSNSNQIVFVEDKLYHYIDRPSTSLIKTFHKNSFELYIKKLNSVAYFLNAWNVNILEQNKILANVIVTGIRYCINNLFAFKNNLSEVEKRAYIKMMICNIETQKYIKYYHTFSKNDTIYKNLISNRAVFFLYLLCKIKK